MRVLIDGDAFPNIEDIINVCKEYHQEVIIYIDTSHMIESNYAQIVTTSTGSNAVDLVLENDILKGDLVLTGDYGVAVIALSKKAYAMNQYGNFYKNNNIDYLMEAKNINLKMRKYLRNKGPKKRTIKDKERLINNIVNLIGGEANEKEK